MRLKGKTALVTGSTSGIGLGIAKAFAAEGADTIINGFGEADAIEAERAGLEAISGGRAAHDGADLTKPEEIAAMFARADRSEEHTSELQSLMRISYAGFCLKKKKKHI